MCDENCEKLIYIYIYLKKAKIRGKFHIQVLSRETPFNPFAAEALGVQGWKDNKSFVVLCISF